MSARLTDQRLNFDGLEKTVERQWQPLSTGERAILEENSKAMAEKYHIWFAKYKQTKEYSNYQEYPAEFEAVNNSDNNETQLGWSTSINQSNEEGHAKEECDHGDAHLWTERENGVNGTEVRKEISGESRELDKTKFRPHSRFVSLPSTICSDELTLTHSDKTSSHMVPGTPSAGPDLSTDRTVKALVKSSTAVSLPPTIHRPNDARFTSISRHPMDASIRSAYGFDTACMYGQCEAATDLLRPKARLPLEQTLPPLKQTGLLCIKPNPTPSIATCHAEVI